MTLTQLLNYETKSQLGPAGIGGGVGYGSLGLSVRNPASGRLRAVAESIVARRLMDHFRSRLTEAGLDMAFTETEMPSLLTMARMELNGFGEQVDG